MSDSRKSRSRLRVALTTSASLFAASASANIFEGIREVDLNDYALGVAVSASASPFVGAEDSTLVYPYLTSFVDPAFTTQRFVVRDGTFGARWVTKKDWEFGLLGYVRTLGFGGEDVPELRGLRHRDWALEFSPLLGYRGWPVHIDLQMFADITGRRDGVSSQLTLSLPWAGSRGYVVPAVQAIYHGKDYTDYYFGVESDEALATRPAYLPGSALNLALKLRWGYALSPKWLLSGSIGMEWLDEEITNSPIVDKDNLWSAKIGLAYNADLFAPRAAQIEQSSRGEFRVGALRDSLRTKINQIDTDGLATTYTGEDLALPEKADVIISDAFVRFGHYHRVEAGYFETYREGALDDRNAQLKSRMLWLGYGYSLMRDAQKELGLTAAIHRSDVSLYVTSGDPDEQVNLQRTAPLPAIGAFGSAALGEHWKVEARLRLFRLNFDKHEGSLSQFSVGLRRSIGDYFNAGIAYNYYRINLESRDDDFTGSILTEHSGPMFFLSANF